MKVLQWCLLKVQWFLIRFPEIMADNCKKRTLISRTVCFRMEVWFPWQVHRTLGTRSLVLVFSDNFFWHVARKKSCVHDGYVLKHRTMWRDLEIKGPKRLDRVVGPKWFGVYIRSVSGPKRLVAWAEMGPNVFDLPNFTFLWATCAVGFESVRLDFSALTGMDHYCCLLRVCLYVQDCQSPGHRSLPL